MNENYVIVNTIQTKHLRSGKCNDVQNGFCNLVMKNDFRMKNEEPLILLRCVFWCYVRCVSVLASGRIVRMSWIWRTWQQNIQIRHTLIYFISTRFAGRSLEIFIHTWFVTRRTRSTMHLNGSPNRTEPLSKLFLLWIAFEGMRVPLTNRS